jgi:SulP family sulfate permease
MTAQATFVPKLWTTLQSYDRQQFGRDAIAGIIVGIVAIPLAIAFAIASGVTPDRGLWTAIVAGFLISALGGSRVQIGGPTGAFVVIVYGIVQKYGVDGLTVATFMAGALLLVMGAAKLGNMIKFIPHPVITGFTSGIAVIIFSSQVKDLFGLRMGAVPAEFLAKWQAFADHAYAPTPAAAGVAAFTWRPRRLRSSICPSKRSALDSARSTRRFLTRRSRTCPSPKSRRSWDRRSRSPCLRPSNRSCLRWSPME